MGLNAGSSPCKGGVHPGALCVPENPKITTLAVPLLFLSILFNYSNPSWGVNYKKLSYLGTQESREPRQVAIAADNRVWVRSLGPAPCLLCSICCSHCQKAEPRPLPQPPACPHFSIPPAGLPGSWAPTHLSVLCKAFLSAVSADCSLILVLKPQTILSGCRSGLAGCAGKEVKSGTQTGRPEGTL